MIFTKTDKETLNQIFNHLLTMKTETQIEHNDLNKICDILNILVENQRNLNLSFNDLKKCFLDKHKCIDPIEKHEKPKKKVGRPKKEKTPDQ